MSVFGILATGAMNAGTSVLNNILAGQQTARDREQNFQLNERAADAAMRRQIAMYERFYSPEALLKQYTKAGLSPSMMFGGTPGQGGTSGPQGAGANGLQTPYMPMSMLEAAQIANINADTEIKKAEVKTTEAKGWAEIANLTADTLNKKQQAKLAEAETTFQELQNYVTSNTKDASIAQILALSEKAEHEAETAYEVLMQNKYLTKINEETWEDQVKLKKKEVEALAQSISESKSVVRLNDQKRRQLYNDILAMWEQIDINWKAQAIGQQQADTQQEQAEIYKKWIEEQIPIMKEQLGIRLKELDIEKAEMIIDAVTGTIKAIAFGAMSYASFQGGKGSMQTGPQPQPMPKEHHRGGKAIYPGVPHYKHNRPYDQ